MLIKTRTQLVRACEGVVIRVGASYEPLPDTLSQLQLFKLGGIGIPLLIQLPDKFESRPGEIVDITFATDPSGEDAEDMAKHSSTTIQHGTH